MVYVDSMVSPKRSHCICQSIFLSNIQNTVDKNIVMNMDFSSVPISNWSHVKLSQEQVDCILYIYILFAISSYHNEKTKPTFLKF